MTGSKSPFCASSVRSEVNAFKNEFSLNSWEFAAAFSSLVAFGFFAPGSLTPFAEEAALLVDWESSMADNGTKSRASTLVCLNPAKKLKSQND
ncbi:MAG: hypothetical protein EBU49_06285 [Proteobacteria bacterium]|nr:hypothetical protein [Pseudomonadota bacterium]